MATRTPPRFVPTLTEVVQSPPTAPAAGEQPVFGISEEQWVHRIMQRMDLTLERRLREAIATVVLEHTQSMGPALRAQVEAAVREAVTQAMADELAAVQKSIAPRT